MTAHTPRAVGIVRVSVQGDREGESFASPRVQCDRMQTLADREGWQLTIPEPHEINVSGNALLQDRPQLSAAVVAVQTGTAEIICADTTDRLWWNHEVRSQVLRLVESVGGEVWAADEGKLSNGSAADEFSGTVRTAADRLRRMQDAEKSRRAVERAIARGVAPWPWVSPGYLRGADGVLVPDPATRDAVAEAFTMRAGGATIAEVRAHLAEHGIRISYAGVGSFLRSPVYLGEIRFGDYEPNLAAHEPIVDRDVWNAVQRVVIPKGRLPKSERLLARQGVLRCGTCGGRMTVDTSDPRPPHGKRYSSYVCRKPPGDCSGRAKISAPMVEAEVVDAVKAATADLEGRASAEGRIRDAELAADQAQQALDAAIRAFTGLEGEAAARDRLEELRAARDAAVARVDELGGSRATVTVRTATDWDRLTLPEQRALVRATIARVTVTPGKGPGRVTVELLPE